MLDILAYLILLAGWLLGGAAIFCGPDSTYRNTLLGWSVLNAYIAGLVLFFCVLLWALDRVVISNL